MKAQSKNRKHPTCSRCRFHGKKDVRVLQHQCPFKNCPCSSCLLIKRRSIIYRAQKNLDKLDENSDDQPSSPSSASTNSSGCIGSPHLPIPLQSHSELTVNNGSSAWIPSTTNTSLSKHCEYPKISDFQTLCVTFPDYSPSHLQSLFEQCGSDFQRTIDKILMTKWCTNEPEGRMVTNGSSIAPPHTYNDYGSLDGNASNYGSSYNDWNSQRVISSNGYCEQDYFSDHDASFGQRIPQSTSWRYAGGGGGVANNYTQNYNVDGWSNNDYHTSNCGETLNWTNCYVNSFVDYSDELPANAVYNNVGENGVRSMYESEQQQYDSTATVACVGSSSGSELESSQQSVNSYSSSISDEAQDTFVGNKLQSSE